MGKANKTSKGQKPKHQTLIFDFGVPVALDNVSISPGGQVVLMAGGKPIRPVRAWVGEHRDREKGEKKILQIPIPTARVKLGEMSALAHFDRIFAIDTSTKMTLDTIVSVAFACECRLLSNSYQQVFVVGGLCYFHFCNVQEKQENFAWDLLIKSIKNSRGYSDNVKYAIITDSDLGNHNNYNDHVTPYFLDQTLPENVTLLYAFDKGNNFSNRAIKKCDKEAARQLSRILSGALPLKSMPMVIDAPCSHYQSMVIAHEQAHTLGWYNITPIQL
ncbi:hypothetical protein [Humidesulfovibrio sp.]